jgi:phenylacetate-coenzyme A ligase PaaK-like adenylate-forming protein
MNGETWNIEDLKDLAPANFFSKALSLMQYQAENNAVYNEWVRSMKVQLDTVHALDEIPFLPIHFFKTHAIFSGRECPAFHFESSGTTQDIVSKHFVKELSVYEQSFMQCFQQFYGSPKDYCILGLLPSYLERQHSSLVYMTDHLIKASANSNSGFYLYDFKKLNDTLAALENAHQKTLLIGVSYALMDFVDAYPQKLNHTIVMETGGMKGRKQELTKPALHAYLAEGFGVQHIHSEYGMTELLSQAYSKGDGIYTCPPWMKVLVADESDPTALNATGRGVLHIIDLANVNSCAFIATEDIGMVYPDGSFEVQGRLDQSARRGCSLLVV